MKRRQTGKLFCEIYRTAVKAESRVKRGSKS